MRLGRRAVVAAKSLDPVAGHGRNHSVVNSANSIVRRIGDVDVARAVHRDAPRLRQLGTRGWPAITAESGGAAAGHQSHDAGGGVPAKDAVVIGEVEVASGIG